MFDIGFFELCLVGLVSLLVIGPEKLPKVARIAGFWVGKAQHRIKVIKTEINQELHAEELRQILEEQKQDLKNVQSMIDKTSEITETTKEALMQLDKDSATQAKKS